MGEVLQFRRRDEVRQMGSVVCAWCRNPETHTLPNRCTNDGVPRFGSYECSIDWHREHMPEALSVHQGGHRQ